MLKFERFDVLTFDCYGTLIDWEQGILTALRPVLSRYQSDLADDEILELYAILEAQVQAGGFQPYKAVLRQVVKAFGERLGFIPTPAELDSLRASLGTWPPFPDTVEALGKLRERFKLGVISNIDDDLFAQSARHLQIDFDWIITAEQVRSYKPSLHNFRAALERIGRPAENILHVAQSLYHDIVPARQLGLSTVWVNRRRGKASPGATPAARAKPDLEVPDLRSLVTAMES